jgi:hypothetical protein
MLYTNIVDWSLVYCRNENRTAAGASGCCALSVVWRTGEDANRLTPRNKKVQMKAPHATQNFFGNSGTATYGVADGVCLTAVITSRHME